MPFYVMGLAGMLVSILVLGWKAWGPEILINETPSEPLGLYRIIAHDLPDYRRGMTVVFPVPSAFRTLVYGRRWLRGGMPLLKQIGALAGDRVCIFTHRFAINGRTLGPVFTVDSSGRPLPEIRGCFEVKPGDFFAASLHLDKSFDGRYFGVLPLSQLQGEARPLWTF